MGKKKHEEAKGSGILCTTLSNNSSKIIFEDNILCCQFLNDYVDLPHFKEVKPEDIRDVSTEFVPQFSNERQADRVKGIKIRGEKDIPPFFLISLIEHKSDVEYNIHMQIFRYMVYIWEKYERRMEKEKKGCTRLKDFRYPPIIPIVYYEGKRKWTAPKEFKDRIAFGGAFKEYLPNFSYYMVPVHTYSNDALIGHEDAISLVMLINKLQTKRDIELLQQIPAEKMDRAVKNIPDYLLDIIANVFRAFLKKINAPEDEAEALVGKIKEKKMGELFANMDKMDIQAERRKTAEERENGIRDVVSVGKQFGATKEELADRLRKTHGFALEEAMEKVERYWNQPEAVENKL